MKKIDKGPEPASLTVFKQANPQARYQDLSDVERQDIRQSCSREQFYLCAYCCQAISGANQDTMNEHVVARRLAPERSLDFSNIVASCTTPKQCDSSHDSQDLPLTPFMPECEDEFRFKLSGRVEGVTERAREAIRVLNLGDAEENNKGLIEKRKQLVNTLIWKDYGNPELLTLEDDRELLNELINELNRPQDGKLEPFAPVLVNILTQL